MDADEPLLSSGSADSADASETSATDLGQLQGPASGHGQQQHLEPQQQRNFNPASAVRHAYLGDLDDLPAVALLDEGTCYHLPALPLTDVVPMPGSTIPLKLTLREELRLLETSLAHPPETARVIVMVHQRRYYARQPLDDLVGCTAEIRQLRRQPDGSVTIVARGRQRVLRLKDGKPATQPWSAQDEGFQMHVRVLPECDVESVPRPLREGAAFHEAWAARPFDPQWLSKQVLERCSMTLPAAAHFIGRPLELSYWLAANLPLDIRSRLMLLQCRSSVERLRRELDLLAELAVVRCRGCNSKLASAGDALRMTEEGIAGVFVNAHGYVHDMATFSQIQGVVYQGRPETEHSWFPGYSWTICNCRRCFMHLGWRFDNVQPGLTPTRFWGLRRPALVTGQAEGEGDADEDMDEDGEEESGEGDSDSDDDLELYMGEGEPAAPGGQALGVIPRALGLRVLRFLGRS